MGCSSCKSEESSNKEEKNQNHNPNVPNDNHEKIVQEDHNHANKGKLPESIQTPAKVNDNLQIFRNEALNAHNEFRQLHNAPPLKSDPEADIIAQAYA